MSSATAPAVPVRVAGKGVPVLLAPGLGLRASVWLPVVAPLVSAGFRVIAVDRPGFGEAPESAEPLVLSDEVNRFVAALDAADCSEPVILVGHSFAGFFIEAFGRLRSDRTAGLVFADSSVEIGLPARSERALQHLLAVPPRFTEQLLGRFFRSFARELRAYLPVAAELEQLRQQAELADVPIEVLTAVSTISSQTRWVEAQRDLARVLQASPRTRKAPVAHHLVHGKHLLMRSSPDAVVASIRRVASDSPNL